jgi:hypothetical protein
MIVDKSSDISCLKHASVGIGSLNPIRSSGTGRNTGEEKPEAFPFFGSLPDVVSRQGSNPERVLNSGISEG